MPSTAEWGLITTAGAGIAGIAGTLFGGALQRKNDRAMALAERRGASYVAALKVMDLFVGAAGRNVIPDGSGYKDAGEPSKDDLALNAAQLRVFGTARVY